MLQNFKENKYTKIYFCIIENALSSDRKYEKGIHETHHIIPKSIGGNNDKNNLVVLTLKEHYICHRILLKIVQDEHKGKMIYALWCMINGNGKSNRYIPSGKLYNELKSLQSKERSIRLKGKNNPFFGKKHSDNFRIWLSENNPMKNEEIRNKTKGKRPNFKPHNFYNGWSEDVKEKLRAANIGKKHTQETKDKMKKSKENLIWIKKNGEKSKQIKIYDFDYYAPNGWTRGRNSL